MASRYIGACGLAIKIDHGNGYESTYCLASQLIAKEGKQVKQGKTVALVGSTGQSTGPHLHWGVKKDGQWIDPETLLF